jgi:DNA-binding beta-propeller fold protein YncE
MLKRKPWFLPTSSIPAIIGFVVLIGCNKVLEPRNTPEAGIQISDKIYRGLLYHYVHPANGGPAMWVPYPTPPPPYLPPGVTPVDQATQNPSRGSGADALISRALRAATAAALGSPTVVYLLDEYGTLFQYDPGSSTIVAQLNLTQSNVPTYPQRLAVTPDGNFAFITANASQTATSGGTAYVLVVNLNSFSIASTITLPAATVVQGLAITPDGSLVYVVTQPYSGSGPSEVLVIDVASRTIRLTIPVAGYSNLGQIAITPDGSAAYLVNSIDSDGFSIPVLDLQSNTVQPSLPIYFGSGQNLTSGYQPSYMAMHPDGTRLYLAPVSGGPVLIVSTIAGMVTNTIPLATAAGPVFGARPTFTADGSHLALMSGPNLWVYVDTFTDTVDSTIALTPAPFGAIRNAGFFFVPTNP